MNMCDSGKPRSGATWATVALAAASMPRYFDVTDLAKSMLMYGDSRILCILPRSSSPPPLSVQILC